jgi:hypothetical protein
VSDLGYWSGNEEVTKYFFRRLRGKMVSPKLEGTNFLRSYTSCAYIYSGKALPSDGPSMEVFGLRRADIERAREIEGIIQFVMRGRLRCADFDDDYRVYLYDLHQAQALADYLMTEGIAEVELIPVEEAGILDYERPVGRKAIEQDAETHEAKKRKRGEADRRRKSTKRLLERESKRRNGHLRSRGKPRKTA